ncbi:MAG: glycosyltransferase family 2 protein [Parvularculaceae bacterium]
MAQEGFEEQPAVSAIIVSFFTGPLLARAIASLKAAPEIREIIVVDNGNWEGAVQAAADASPDGAPVEIVSGHGNVGFATACNLGAKRARGDCLLFLNPDAIMPTGGLARIITDGAKLERPWLIGPMIANPDGTEQQGSRRQTLTPWTAFVEATRLHRVAPRHPYFRRFNIHGDPRPAEVTPVPVISGACFFLHKEDYFLIGGMDERYFLHVEDVDFCLRFAKAGGRVFFDPHVGVVHHKSSSRVSAMRVERRKTASVIRYFNTHFSEPYPAPFLWLVAALLWGVFGLKLVARAASRAGSFLKLRARSGAAVVRRARQISAQRRSRRF